MTPEEASGDHSDLSVGAGDESVVHETDWRGSECTPVYATVTAVARAEGTDPVDLPPIFQAVDPDALNGLFQWDGDPATGQVAFRYCGYHVVVTDSVVQLRRED